MEIFDNNSNKLLAIVHRYLSIENKKNFLTNPKEQFQMGAFNLPKGEEILKHVHLNNDRNVNITPEGIVVLDGKLKVSVFNSIGYLSSVSKNLLFIFRILSLIVSISIPTAVSLMITATYSPECEIEIL